jgi:hypothetical protein
MKRGQLGARTVEPGEVFECPTEHLALCMTGPAGEALGWMEPARGEDRAAADAMLADLIARSREKPSNPHVPLPGARLVRVTTKTASTAHVGRYFRYAEKPDEVDAWIDIHPTGQWFAAGTILEIPERMVEPAIHTPAPEGEQDPADAAALRRYRARAASTDGRLAAAEASNAALKAEVAGIKAQLGSG